MKGEAEKLILNSLGFVIEVILALHCGLRLNVSGVQIGANKNMPPLSVNLDPPHSAY
ncbi:UNVERIFIED_CONTAM: hypothetical protein FKN15_060349 [Acipenser sinensis]